MNNTEKACMRKGWQTVYKTIWPIQKSETKLVLINALILFSIIFNYTVLRNLKDTLINTAASSGPEVTTFIKGWLVLPISIVWFILITKISNKVSRENIFYISSLFFLGFFALFCFYLYPNKDTIHPSLELIQSLQHSYPSLRWIFPIYGIWSYSLFYIMAELWGSIMMSLLFWEYANEITSTKEAKRFYPFFILLANVGLIAAGLFVGSIVGDLPNNSDASLYDLSWYRSLRYITSVILIIGVIGMLLYKWSNKIVNKNRIAAISSQDPATKVKALKKTKLKLNFLQSVKCIFSSPYLGLIAILVISYGAAINLVELIWKKQLALYYTLPSDYCAFMSKFSLYTGITTIITILFTKNILQSSNWFRAAIFTPVILAITGGIFFIALFYKNYLVSNGILFGSGLSVAVTLIGAIQNILTKSSKYALFDPSKEMTYIPLDTELKMKGKAAVDVVGERLGKAGGGYLQQFLLIATGGSILGLTPILFVLVVIIIAGWIFAVFKLDNLYNRLLNKDKYSDSTSETTSIPKKPTKLGYV